MRCRSLPAKMKLQRSLPTVQGSCQWYSAAVLENPGNYATLLEKDYHRYPALIPTSPFIDDKAPGKVKKLKMVWTSQGPVLFWTAPKAVDEMDKAVQYVVYRFKKGEKVNLNDPSKIVAITRDTFTLLPYEEGKVNENNIFSSLNKIPFKGYESINELNTALSIEYTNFSMAKEQKQELRIPNNNPPSDPSKEKLFNILNAYKK